MNYTQENRPMAVTTPLGADKLLLMGFTGQEAVSRLFSFQLDMIAENDTDVAFDKLLGQKITVRLNVPDDKERYFNGICKRVSQGEQGNDFTSYRMEIVPQFWMLTKKAQSRIFQQKSVPDILKKVLEGLDVTYEIQGNFEPRDFCVQYRETDFNFASRLMEEEGIFYFFKHSDGGHQMVVANSPSSHKDLPNGSTIIYEEIEGGGRDEDRIFDWEKAQEWRSGKYTLWDHCFELPHKHLEVEANILDSVQAGKVSHKLKVANNDKMEIYDYPGEYAQRFDGVQPGGGDRASDLQKIFQDNKRTVDLRIEEEAAVGLVIQGASSCRDFVSGYKFTLQRHFNADGAYVLTSVAHSARQSGDYRSGSGDFHYTNSFTCIPVALPFRPQRLTPKPVVQGTQTAIVVGPGGEEIFTDKYGRVKVQFHWDREGKNNEESSCWVRVGTLWAGKQWGVIHIPRINQEVIVDFLEGDPDQPIIIGSVYNAREMPPYDLPDEKTKSTVKTRSSKQGTSDNYNEIRFEDKKGNEQIFINAEKDMDTRVENDDRQIVKNDRHVIIENDHREKIGNDMSIQIGNNLDEKTGTKFAHEAGQEIHLKAGMKVIIEAMQVSIKGAGGFVDVGPSGVTIQGTMVLINSGGSAGSGSGASPQDPDEADDGTKTGKMN
ncbi:MAG: type VI secretion system Vgr family protein [Alphaproteobacteria bacterium]